MRLDVFLSEQLEDVTRSHIAKLLKRGAGTVNGKPATVHQFLKIGDKIEFDDAERTVKGKLEVAKPAPPLEIIEETKDWMVINKQAGVVVHPDATHKTGTLVDALMAYDPKIGKIGEDPERPGIMHRLDKEASGLMVIAKTQDAFDNLKKQFAEHTVDKRYIALVFGNMPENEGDIKFRIGHSSSKSRMAAHPVQEENVGKAAWTHYEVIEKLRDAQLLELSIFSGRTHQIRVHLLAMNHPIMGDPLYKRPREDRTTKAPRLMLQSVHLAFIDPASGEKKEFDLKPAAEFEWVKKQLR